MQKFLSAHSLGYFVDKGLNICRKISPGDEGLFTNGACEQWDSLSSVPHLPADTDTGCALSVRLGQMLSVSNGIVMKVLAARSGASFNAN